jgi:VanZ family protein
MKKTGRERLIRYTPFLLWTGIVMAFSTSGASMSRTSRFIRPILEFLFPGSPEATLVFYHGLVRKSAHIFEYALLSLLAARAFTGSSRKLLGRHPLISAVLAAAAVALVDEFNQSFDPSRTGTLRDVALDVSAATAAALCLAAYRQFRKN